MAFNPLDWFRSSAAGAPAEPRKQFVAGLVVWVLAWLIVWWIQDQRAKLSVEYAARRAAQKDINAKTIERNTPIIDVDKLPDAAREVVGGDTTSTSLGLWGLLIAVGLFWGGGLLIFRALTGWGFFLSWLRRCETVEQLAFVSAVVLTVSAIVLHWIWNLVEAWMLAAVVAMLILGSAFGWKLPGKKQL